MGTRLPPKPMPRPRAPRELVPGFRMRGNEGTPIEDPYLRIFRLPGPGGGTRGPFQWFYPRGETPGFSSSGGGNRRTAMSFIFSKKY